MDKNNLLNKGADIVGSISGAGVGLVIAGTPGAMWGSVLGPVVTNVVKDIGQRLLSPREKIRLDNAVEYINDGIDENIKSGKIPRQDDFFEGDTNFSSNGRELLEGVLLKCRSEYQNKKVKLIANIFKNVAFDSNIKPETAYHILNLAESLTYHELCLLSFFGDKMSFYKSHSFNCYDFSQSHSGNTLLKDSPDAWERMQDLISMYRQGLIKDSHGNSHLGSDTLKPSSLILETRGEKIFELMELATIPKLDVLAIVKPLGSFHESFDISDPAEGFLDQADKL